MVLLKKTESRSLSREHLNLKVMKTNANKIFKERAEAVHGSAYDYSIVRYKGALQKVSIKCRRHGVFKQTPNSHYKGAGCPYCADKRMLRDEFLERVTNMYQDKLDFSKCGYTHKNSLTDNIRLHCKTHGGFNAKINAILRGHGCKKCELIEKTNRKKEKRNDNSAKTNPPIASIDDTNFNNSNLKYYTIVKYRVNNTEAIAVTITDFKSMELAESFIENNKMFIEMTDSILIEAMILNTLKPNMMKSINQEYLRTNDISI